MFEHLTAMVTDFAVLDDEQRFVHFVSHFAYLAGSCSEQFNGELDALAGMVVALVDLFLAAPDVYWCGEELLVANLFDQTFAKMLDGLKPQMIMQDADQWDEAAVSVWKAGTVRENHKRQLVFAIQGPNVLLKEKPAVVFEDLLAQNVVAKFG